VISNIAPTAWTHLVRFVAEEDNQVHLGNVDAAKYPDVGLSTFNGERVAVNLVTGSEDLGQKAARIYAHPDRAYVAFNLSINTTCSPSAQSDSVRLMPSSGAHRCCLQSLAPRIVHTYRVPFSSPLKNYIYKRRSRREIE
jgi:hypothetical protein